jgi:hypothetical protein
MLVSVIFVLVWARFVWVRVSDPGRTERSSATLQCEHTFARGTDKAGLRLETGPAEMRMPRRQVTTIR